MTTTSKKRSPNKLELFDSNTVSMFGPPRGGTSLDLSSKSPAQKMALNEAQVWLSLRLKIGLV